MIAKINKSFTTQLSLAIILFFSLQIIVEATQTCLYCKRADTNAGFLYSYSYCPLKTAEACIPDLWTYINPVCVGAATKDGWTLDIKGDCNATVQKCFDFTSTKLAVGATTIKKDSYTTLGVNLMCTIQVDATAFVGRITFYDSNNALGVMFPGYTLGQPITVAKGKIQ